LADLEALLSGPSCASLRSLRLTALAVDDAMLERLLTSVAGTLRELHVDECAALSGLLGDYLVRRVPLLTTLSVGGIAALSFDHVKTLIATLTVLETLDVRGLLIAEDDFSVWALSLIATHLRKITSPSGAPFCRLLHPRSCGADILCIIQATYSTIQAPPRPSSISWASVTSPATVSSFPATTIVSVALYVALLSHPVVPL